MTVKSTVEIKHASGVSTIGNAKSGKSFVESPQPVPHSRHNSQRSEQYHKMSVGGPRHMDTGRHNKPAIDDLNPSNTGPQIRSYPGLAN